MADEVVLLSFWVSPFGLRAQIAMAEKGVAYEYKEESPFDKSPLLLQSNPVHKKVPVLLHGGKIVCESNNIVQYVDEAWSHRGPALLPQDPYLRANARFWADYIDKKIFECGGKVWRSNGEAQAEAARELVSVLKQLEGELGEKQFFGGDAFGYVDVALIAFAGWLQACERLGGFTVAAECPKLEEWMRRCMERDSVAKVLPEADKVYEFICAMRKKMGLE